MKELFTSVTFQQLRRSLFTAFAADRFTLSLDLILDFILVLITHLRGGKKDCRKYDK